MFLTPGYGFYLKPQCNNVHALANTLLVSVLTVHLVRVHHMSFLPYIRVCSCTHFLSQYSRIQLVVLHYKSLCYPWLWLSLMVSEKLISCVLVYALLVSVQWDLTYSPPRQECFVCLWTHFLSLSLKTNIMLM